jgi:MFS family permease
VNSRWLAASVALGNLLVPLNSTMIVVALPQVARDLKVDVAETSWIVTSYLIAMAALQPIAGRVGDRLGRRNVMLVALVYFALASAGAAAANSILVLAVFRINQAIAAAALVPNGLGLLREAIPSGRRGAEFGIVSAATAVGATAGPLVGGFLAAIDWRWIFLVNVPLCVA